MAKDFVMPKLAMAMNEGTINEWLVEEGQQVNKGEPLATVETEKVSYDVESPESGIFHRLVAAGETVPVETAIGRFAESDDEYQQLLQAGQAAAAPADAAAEKIDALPAAENTRATSLATAPIQQHTSGERIKSSPLARKLARENQLELARVNGSGPGGRIVKRDILVALERGLNAPAAVDMGGNMELARIPMAGMRQTIAKRMQESLHNSAQLSSSWESDITDLLALRSRFVQREEQLGSRVSVNAFLIKALCYAISRVPIVNSCQEGDEIVIYRNVNLGIAIALPGRTEYDSTLMVPVLKNVERLGLVEIDREMKALIQRAREGALAADEMTGSTITFSSTAGLAPPGMTTTPVLNLPNAALVGPSTPIERPVVRNGEIAVRTMMPVNFTFDHRLLDGEPAARFMQALHDCLEDPGLMLA